jgi:hypothetical protein
MPRDRGTASGLLFLIASEVKHDESPIDEPAIELALCD